MKNFRILMKRETLAIATLAAALFAGTGGAKAQFSMNSIGRDANPTVAIPVAPGSIDAHVLNDAEARVLRRTAWNERNSVDFNVSLTGMVTQYNKAWVKDNQNSVSSELSAYYYHTYTRDKYTSRFKFDGIYGMNFIDDMWFKNQDKLALYHLSSWKMREKGALKYWAYSFEATFRSQFAEGLKSRTDRTIWSNFMAPGTVDVGVGLTYTSPSPKLPFIVTINPIAGNALFVLDRRIMPEAGKDNIHGIPVSWVSDPSPDDPNRMSPVFKNNKLEGGSSLNVDFNRTFVFGGGGGKGGLTLQYITTLNSFYGWMTQISRHSPVQLPAGAAAPKAIVPTTSWTNRLIFNPLKFLSVEFRTTTLYDRSQVNRVQMQYYLRVGLTYGYKNR